MLKETEKIDKVSQALKADILLHQKDKETLRYMYYQELQLNRKGPNDKMAFDNERNLTRD